MDPRRADPRTTARVGSWPAPLSRYGDAPALLEAVGRDGALSMEEADELLAELVRIGRHDALAGRIVLQRVLPGLVAAAVRRTTAHPADRQAVFDDLVANAWVVIRTFPLERRPAKIAVNVLRDAEYLTCVRPTRLRSALERPIPVRPDARLVAASGLDGRPEERPPAAIEVVDVLALGASCGLCRRDLSMLGDATVGGLSVGEVAARFQVTTRTVLNRRRRTTAALAALAALATA